MSNTTNIPKDYQPFEKLVICGNTLINGKIPIAVDGNPIFLIGKGDPPKLWLNVQNKDKVWSYVVDNGASKNINVRVLHIGRVATIYLKEQVILQATKETESYMIITHIDLTPFGLEIKGDISSLRIGGHQMVGNTFENVETMVDVK
jgi:hypothetical protein